MTNPKSEYVIAMLTHVHKRPGMYFSDTSSPVENFFAGFSLALGDLTEGSDMLYKNVLESHGLQHNKGIYQQLKERGLGDDEATQVYLSIMIESFQRSYSGLQENSRRIE
jgi:hypothetical protein